jgi:S1-C subfamily serine protease
MLGRPRTRAALGALSALAILGGGGLGAALSSATNSAGATTRRTTHASRALSGASALQNAYVHVVHVVRASVVQLTTSAGLGSGIIYDTKGDIVTNDHVVGSAKTVMVQFLSGTTAKATVVGTFPADDLAVVRVRGVSTKLLKPARFAKMSTVTVGDIALAIGNPLAYESSVTSGIISATGRTVVEPRSSTSPGGVIQNAIQTSAPINPGNSGGALVDLAGTVVGIPTVTAVDPQIGGAAIGIGFAIPASTVTEIAGQIIAHGHVVNSHRADLGIYSYQATNGVGQAIGVAVEKLLSPSPAGKAGIAPGDVITAVNGTATTTTAALETVLAKKKPGDKVKVTYLRPDGKRATVTVTLGTLPAT